MSKYGNRKTVVDSIEFDSKAEANRWFMLKVLERAGLISDLQRQVKFELAPPVRIGGRGRPALRYFADFVYLQDGQRVVEDVKGKLTEGYRIKRHLMKAIHDIEIKEVA